MFGSSRQYLMDFLIEIYLKSQIAVNYNDDQQNFYKNS